MRYLALLLILIPSVASASDYCFCPPASPKVTQKAVIRTPEVINRFVSLQSPNEPAPVDYEGIIAEARALEMALQAIPGIDKDLEAPQWRQFRFRNNVGSYVTRSQQQQRQAVETRAVTRTYVGVADISFRIRTDGRVDFQVDGEQQSQQQYQQQSSGYGY